MLSFAANAGRMSPRTRIHPLKAWWDTRNKSAVDNQNFSVLQYVSRAQSIAHARDLSSCTPERPKRVRHERTVPLRRPQCNSLKKQGFYAGEDILSASFP